MVIYCNKLFRPLLGLLLLAFVLPYAAGGYNGTANLSLANKSMLGRAETQLCLSVVTHLSLIRGHHFPVVRGNVKSFSGAGKLMPDWYEAKGRQYHRSIRGSANKMAPPHLRTGCANKKTRQNTDSGRQKKNNIRSQRQSARLYDTANSPSYNKSRAVNDPLQMSDDNKGINSACMIAPIITVMESPRGKSAAEEKSDQAAYSYIPVSEDMSIAYKIKEGASEEETSIRWQVCDTGAPFGWGERSKKLPSFALTIPYQTIKYSASDGYNLVFLTDASVEENDGWRCITTHSFNIAEVLGWIAENDSDGGPYNCFSNDVLIRGRMIGYEEDILFTTYDSDDDEVMLAAYPLNSMGDLLPFDESGIVLSLSGVAWSVADVCAGYMTNEYVYAGVKKKGVVAVYRYDRESGLLDSSWGYHEINVKNNPESYRLSLQNDIPVLFCESCSGASSHKYQRPAPIQDVRPVNAIMRHSRSADNLSETCQNRVPLLVAGQETVIDLSYYTGMGMQPGGVDGALDSCTFQVNNEDGGLDNFGNNFNVDFEAEQQALSNARGPDRLAGGTTTGDGIAQQNTNAGFYHYMPQADVHALWIQQDDSFFTPGVLMVRVLNDVAGTVTRMSVSFEHYVRNDRQGSSKIQLFYSVGADPLATVLQIEAQPLLYSFTTPEDRENPATVQARMVTQTFDLSLLEGDFVFLYWLIDDDNQVRRGRDEIAISSVSVTPLEYDQLEVTPSNPGGFSGQSASEEGADISPTSVGPVMTSGGKATNSLSVPTLIPTPDQAGFGSGEDNSLEPESQTDSPVTISGSTSGVPASSTGSAPTPDKIPPTATHGFSSSVSLIDPMPTSVSPGIKGASGMQDFETSTENFEPSLSDARSGPARTPFNPSGTPPPRGSRSRGLSPEEIAGIATGTTIVLAGGAACCCIVCGCTVCKCRKKKQQANVQEFMLERGKSDSLSNRDNDAAEKSQQDNTPSSTVVIKNEASTDSDSNRAEETELK